VNVSAIDPSTVNRLSALAPLTASTTATAAVDHDGDRDGGGATVSSLGQALARLQQLGQTDPAKLKSVLSDVAARLQAQAQQDGGSQGQLLSDLSGRFRQAAQSGDVSALHAPRAHHHHRHHGAAAYQQAAAQASPTGASGAGDVRSQVEDILGQALAGELATTAASAS
jgi:hypothetical protein